MSQNSQQICCTPLQLLSVLSTNSPLLSYWHKTNNYIAILQTVTHITLFLQTHINDKTIMYIHCDQKRQVKANVRKIYKMLTIDDCLRLSILLTAVSVSWGIRTSCDMAMSCTTSTESSGRLLRTGVLSMESQNIKWSKSSPPCRSQSVVHFAIFYTFCT